MMSKEHSPSKEPFESGEWVVRYDIETSELLQKVIDLAQHAVVASESSSAIIVEYTRNHFHNIARVIDQLGVGGSRDTYIKIEEYLTRDLESPIVRYVPAEILELLANSYGYDLFATKAIVLLREFYRNDVAKPNEPIFTLGHLIVSDFSLLKAAVLAMIRPYQEPARIPELDKEAHRLLYSGLGLKEVIREKKERKSAFHKAKSKQEENIGEWIESVVEDLWENIRKLFWGK